MLQLSWTQENKEAELKAYELIGISYFYSGDMKKAKVYTDRNLRGKCESE